MNNMKNIGIRIIYPIIGVLITITSVKAYTFLAEDINYTKKDGSITNVQNAIEDIGKYSVVIPEAKKLRNNILYKNR